MKIDSDHRLYRVLVDAFCEGIRNGNELLTFQYDKEKTSALVSFYKDDFFFSYEKSLDNFRITKGKLVVYASEIASPAPNIELVVETDDIIRIESEMTRKQAIEAEKKFLKSKNALEVWNVIQQKVDTELLERIEKKYLNEIV